MAAAARTSPSRLCTRRRRGSTRTQVNTAPPNRTTSTAIRSTIHTPAGTWPPPEPLPPPASPPKPPPPPPPPPKSALPLPPAATAGALLPSQTASAIAKTTPSLEEKFRRIMPPGIVPVCDGGRAAWSAGGHRIWDQSWLPAPRTPSIYRRSPRCPHPLAQTTRDATSRNPRSAPPRDRRGTALPPTPRLPRASPAPGAL